MIADKASLAGDVIDGDRDAAHRDEQHATPGFRPARYPQGPRNLNDITRKESMWVGTTTTNLTYPSQSGAGKQCASSRSGGRRAFPSRRSRSTAGPSPGRSGARRGATTSSPTATTRIACPADGPTYATARSSTCEIKPGKITRDRQRVRALRRRDHHLGPARLDMEARQERMCRPDRLTRRAASGQALQERHGRGDAAQRRAVPEARARSR